VLARLLRMGSLAGALGLSCVVALAACSSTNPSDGSGSTPDGGTGGPGPGSDSDSGAPADGSTSDGSASTPPCDGTETTAVQSAIDAAHPASTHVVAAVKTPCGLRYFTSGPSKVDAAKLHRFASVSKTYTGAVVLKLVEDGLVSLDDPASKWLTGIPGGETIHVRHLLQHMSGLAPTNVNVSAPTTPDKMLSSSFQQGQRFTAGSKWEYQNINFVALGVIAEKVTNKTLPNLVRERILMPLGVTATFFEGGETVAGDIVAAETAAGRPGNYSINASAVWGAGSMVGTPSDAAAWIEAIGNGQFLDPTVAAEQKVGVDIATGMKYGLALWDLEPNATFGGGVGYGHYGDLTSADIFNGNCGYHTAAFYFPERKTTIVTILDYEPSDANTSRDAFNAVMKTLFAPK